MLLALVCLSAVTWRVARAQPKLVSIGAASDFSTSVYYDPPNQDKLLSTIIAAEAEPQPAGQFRLKKLKLEAFAITGERQLIVEAPNCLYDSSKQTASSPGALHVQSADGALVLEGEGFFWDQKPQRLTISNRVHTTISVVKKGRSKP